MLALYRRLLAYRRESPALQIGGYRPLVLPGLEESCHVYLREASGEPELPGGRERLLIALNFVDTPCRLPLPNLVEGTIALSTYMDREGEAVSADLELRPHEGVIVELKNGAE
jgi:alpha-glucosidase